MAIGHDGAESSVTFAGIRSKFFYARSYLDNAHAVALDPIVLPLQRGEQVTTGHQGVFGVFADASPDAWGRAVIDRIHGEQASPLGYLLHGKGDRVGNLGFSTAPNVPPAIVQLPTQSALPQALRVIAGLEAGERVVPVLQGLWPDTSLGGARPKITVQDRGAQWLAKFPAKYDDLTAPIARLEHAMHALSKLCGIDSVHSEIVPVDGGDILLVKRFDRTPVKLPDATGELQWSRDAFVSARTVLRSSGLHEYSFVGSYPGLARDLGRWSVNAKQDRLELFRRMVFNCAISNTDDHDLNHGLLADELGAGFRLSPAYDMVPRIPTTKLRVQAMRVGYDAQPTRANILSDCGSFGLTVEQGAAIVAEIEAAVQQHWTRCFSESGLLQPAQEMYASCFQPLE